MLAEAKRKALENPDEFKGKYESLFKTFKDELRNSSASTKNIELLVKALDNEENISKFQNNTFVLALKDEFIEYFRAKTKKRSSQLIRPKPINGPKINKEKTAKSFVADLLNKQKKK